MSAFVVDTNVPIVANGNTEQADSDCVLACISALEEIISDGIIVIDDGLHILTEYMRNLSMSGQPGAGDGFMKWVWSVQAVTERCECVTLTPKDGGDFAEFPNDPELVGFDRADRKFVAVAVASQNDPTVLNAVDTDWANHCQVLISKRLKIRFLCPQHVRPR